MKKNTLVVILLAVTVVMLSLAVVLQSREIAELKGQVADVTAAQKTLVAPAPVPAAVEEEPAAASEPKPVETAVATPIPQAILSGGTTNNPLAGLAEMMKSPQMKEMMHAQQKMAIDGMYGSLSRYLNLSTNEMDSLKELLLQRQMALMDAGMAAMNGSGTDPKQVAADTKAVKDDYDKKIQDLLGPQDYPAFQDYEKTAPDRMSVQMFKGSLPSDSTLTDQQEEDLVTAMAEERKALPPTSLVNNQTPDASKFTEEGVAEALKQMDQLQQRDAQRAAAILTPAQLDQFTKFQQQMNGIAAAGMNMARQMFANKSAPTAPAPSPAQ